MADTIALFIALCIPLGIWKMLDIVAYLCQHMSFVIN